MACDGRVRAVESFRTGDRVAIAELVNGLAAGWSKNAAPGGAVEAQGTEVTTLGEMGGTMRGEMGG